MEFYELHEKLCNGQAIDKERGKIVKAVNDAAAGSSGLAEDVELPLYFRHFQEKTTTNNHLKENVFL